MNRCTCSRGMPEISRLQIRTSPEFREWVRDFARKERQSRSMLVEDALQRLAAHRGYRPPPDRVTGAECDA